MSVEDEDQLTEAPVAALHDNGNNSNSAKHTGIVFNACMLCSILFFLHRQMLRYIVCTSKCKCCLYLVNIQQIAEFSSETHDAVTSMVAMAPGTVAVVQQVSDNIFHSCSHEW